jgi:hypothetical protein
MRTQRPAQARGERERVRRAYYVDAISTDMLESDQDGIPRGLLDIARKLLTVIARQTRHVGSQLADTLDQLENLDHRFSPGTEHEKSSLCRALLRELAVHADASVMEGLRWSAEVRQEKTGRKPPTTYPES